MKNFKALVIVLSVIAVVAIAGLGYFFYVGAQPEDTSKPISREVLEYTEGIVRETKPAPAESARVYAYVATTYNEVLEESNQEEALLASQKILDAIYPDRAAATKTAMEKSASDHAITMATELSDDANKKLTAMTDRLKDDGSTLVWDGVIPEGEGKWIMETDKKPFTPRAGEWERWVVTSDFIVPEPPVYGSEEDLAEVAKTVQESNTRDSEEAAKINFWGGVPGTDAPAGIWQNQLYATVKDELSTRTKKRDAEYAETQMVLAQTLADAFMECWKVKFTYWTARPSMRDKNVNLAMANPPFPSYVSGHSTISKAAAEVLAVTAPSHADEWRQMAIDARDSRLDAGIHFETDNTQGFTLGENVAKEVIEKKNLKTIIK